MQAVYLSKKDIALFALFSLVIGFMTGLGIGHYKNIRFEILKSDIDNIRKSHSDLNSILTSLNRTLVEDVGKSMSKLRQKNAMELGCTKKLKQPTTMVSNFNSTPQVILFNNQLAYKVDNGSTTNNHTVTLQEVSPLIHDRDIILMPPADFNSSDTGNQYELCWIAFANSSNL